MEDHAKVGQTLTRGNASSTSSINNSLWNNSEDDEDLLMIDEDVNMNTSSLRSDERYVGFDNNVGDSWVYPSNFPERAYQYNIVQKALFHNTLVVLPTGLGKTFIAAVVMYNMYRWYPMGKVIFMAPTRPLVTQQIDACCKVMGIPKADSVEITGKLNKASRTQLWQTKRVFFATPQSVQSDIFDTELNFPFDAVKLIVVDEAHRAKGRYAYTDVLRYIWSKNKFFRILALSATPGRRKDDVEEVISNLFISKLEVRTEDSVDVVSYVHKRQMKTVVVKLGQRLSKIRDELLAIVDPHLRRLIDNHLISARPGNVSRNWLVMEQKKFRESVQNDRVPYQKELNSDFSICISIYHAIELLERHGLRVFLNNFDDTQDGGVKFVVILRPDLRRLIERVREEAGPNPFAFSDQCMVNGEIAVIPKNIDFGHPKFEVARDHVLAHFENNKDSRVIIFCEYRESVMLMHRLLLQHRPLIRPRVFVGQGGSGSIRAVTQQQQMKVMNDFRVGESNALIATSVAEEGIDVGEVDLIVCFDINTSNPTRFIQRIGRTGRRKEGKVLLLATEGKEHTILKEVLSERNKLNKSISRGGEFTSIFYKYSPRMVPTVFNPKCIKTFVQPTEEQQPKSKIQNKQKQKNRTVQNLQKRDLRHFFKTKDVLSNEERRIFENSKEPNPIETNKSVSDTLPIEDEDDAIVNFSPPIPTNISSKIIRKYTKFIKNNLRAQIMDARKAVTSNRLSKDSLKFLIDLSPDFLDGIWFNLADIWKKGIDENNVPLKGVTADDRQAIRSYLQIKNLVGSKESVAAIIDNKGKTPKSSSFSDLISKYNFIFGDLHRNDVFQDNFEYLTSKIEKMSKISPSNENSRTSFVQSMVYDGEINGVVEESSEFCDTEHSYANECMVDSKYMSQWVENVPFQTSTSVQDNAANNSVGLTKNWKKCSDAKTTKETEERIDDDVLFVGQTHQSTPIRTGTLKQSLLNFSETPIKKAQFKRTREQIKPGISKLTGNQSSEVSQGNHSNFFDDQFDALIAENSNIIATIEQGTNSKQTPSVSNIQQVSNYISPQTLSPLQNGRKTSQCSETKHTKNNSSSEDIAVLLNDLNRTLQRQVKIDNTSKLVQNVSTPVDISLRNVAHTTPTKRTGLLPDDSTPEDISILGSCYSSRVILVDSMRDNNTGKENIIQSEIEDIKLIDFSDTFSEEISRSHKVQTVSESPSSPLRSSPDIFAEMTHHEAVSKIKPQTPSKQRINPATQVSPCLLTKNVLTWRQVHLKYGKPLQSGPVPVANTQNDSVIQVCTKTRSKRKIISSDSETSDDNLVQHQDSIIDIADSQEFVCKNPLKEKRLPQKRTNEFIDNEAALSGSASEDEFEQTIGCYMADSVVVHDEDAENDAINMTEVYLQSVRSPSAKRGAFKIPPRRQFNDYSKIFSQKIPEESISYLKDSFIVSDEGSDGDQSMCPLERAEQILKERKRTKRKARSNVLRQSTKKKRILRIHNSSEDDDFV